MASVFWESAWYSIIWTLELLVLNVAKVLDGITIGVAVLQRIETVLWSACPSYPGQILPCTIFDIILVLSSLLLY